jgi:hypothetical protein
MDENQKKEFQGMLVKFMEMSLKHSKINVPQPLPLVEEKAEKRLSTDDLIAWKQIMREWSKVSEEGKKVISKLLVVNAYDLVETINLHRSIVDETRDTPDYVKEHPEFEKPDDEIRGESVVDDFKGLFDL